MIKIFLIFIPLIAVFLFLELYILFLLFQEKWIFYGKRLDKNYKFNFPVPFQDIHIKMKDGKKLNALLFSAENPQGLILFLHGTSNANDYWGNRVLAYTEQGYDVLLPDYRGYGKSEGKNRTQKQLLQDMQCVYDKAKSLYREEKIILMGYSIGTGIAAYLAQNNNAKMLILHAPYYSLINLFKKKLPFIPAFFMKYKLKTYQFLENSKIPIIIFHGTNDEVINYHSSIRLQEIDKDSIKLILLKNQGHSKILENEEYRKEIAKILKNLVN